MEFLCDCHCLYLKYLIHNFHILTKINLSCSSKDNRFLAIWKCLLFQDHGRGSQAASQESQAVQLDRLLQVASSHPSWVVIMLRGGHFAAAVLKARGGSSAAWKSKLDPSSEPFDVVEHKTFHRYLVRYNGEAF